MYRTRQMIKNRLFTAEENDEIGKHKQQNTKLRRVVEEISLYKKLKFYIVALFWGLLAFLRLVTLWVWNPKKYFKNQKREKPAPSCLTDSSMGSHSYIKLKGAKLHYVEAGCPDHPLMICLHGFLDCWVGWRFQIAALAPHFRVVAVDLKGYGESEKPMWRGKYKIEEVVTELAEFIVAVGGGKKCVLVGHDLGALIGWFLVYSHPDLISKFVSISCPHPNIYWDELQPTAFVNKTMVHQCQLPDLMERTLMMDDLAIVDAVYNHIIAHPNSELVSKETYKFIFSRKVDWTGAISYYRTLWKSRVREELLGKLDIPLLLIMGDGDKSFSLETAVKSTEIEQKLVVRLVNGAGHAPHQQAAPLVNKLILTFLSVPEGKVGCTSSVPSQLTAAQRQGLVNRMFGAFTSTYSYGNQMLEHVTRKGDPLALPYRSRGCTAPVSH